MLQSQQAHIGMPFPHSSICCEQQDSPEGNESVHEREKRVVIIELSVAFAFGCQRSVPFGKDTVSLKS
jgi:hypothetical protein